MSGLRKKKFGDRTVVIRSLRVIEPLLYKNMGVDGIKTGYLAVEKYSLASIERNGRRLVAVGEVLN